MSRKEMLLLRSALTALEQQGAQENRASPQRGKLMELRSPLCCFAVCFLGRPCWRSGSWLEPPLNMAWRAKSVEHMTLDLTVVSFRCVKTDSGALRR